jgi:hypothetical protein
VSDDGDRAGRWTAERLARLQRTAELEIAVRHADGRTGRWMPVWVVVVGGDVFVRTWQRRETGWYGGVLRTRTALVRADDEPVVVEVEAVGDARRAGVDAAYEAKYGAGGARSMITAEAVASTLRLVPAGG